MTPDEVLRHHVSGAVERGEKAPIVAVEAPVVVAYDETCWCPQPDGQDLLTADEKCRICGTQWKRADA